MQRRTKLFLVLGALGTLIAFAGMVSSASAAIGPMLTTSSSSTLSVGDPIAIAGSNCPPNSSASVYFVENMGLSDENVYKIDFPVAVDGTGAYSSSSTVPATAHTGSTLQVGSKCGNPAADVPLSTLEFSIVDKPAPAVVAETPVAPEAEVEATAAAPEPVVATPAFTG